MRGLFDAHTLLWTLYEPEMLPPRVRRFVEDGENDLYVSLATVWEISNKASVHRLPAVGSSVHKMLERIEDLGVTFVPITMQDILASGELPHHHADPFDRMLVAQAVAHSLILLTKDAKVMQYDVATIWR